MDLSCLDENAPEIHKSDLTPLKFKSYLLMTLSVCLA